MPYLTTRPSILLLAVLLLTLALIGCSFRCGAATESFWHPLRRMPEAATESFWHPLRRMRPPRCGVYDGHPMYDHYCKAGSYADPTCRSGCAAYVPSLGFSTCCKSSCCITDSALHYPHRRHRTLHYPRRFTRLAHRRQPTAVRYQHYRAPYKAHPYTQM